MSPDLVSGTKVYVYKCFFPDKSYCGSSPDGGGSWVGDVFLRLISGKLSSKPPELRVFLNLWFVEPMVLVCLWVAFPGVGIWGFDPR